MARIIWTDPALKNLDEIAEYIALENPGAAQRLVRRVFTRVERLALFPESGRIPPELAESRYREIIIGPCRVFYRYEQDKVYLVYVMRGERELRKYLIDDGTCDVES